MDMIRRPASAPGHQMILAALRHFKWRRNKGETLPGVYEVWQAPRKGPSVLVAVDPNKADYQNLNDKSWGVIESVVGHEATSFVSDFLMVIDRGLALTQWEKETNLSHGMIMWEDGERLILAARAMISAAAKSAIHPRARHGTSSGQFANSYLREIFMGQTAVGSYIVRAHSPLYRQIPIQQRRSQESSLPIDWADDTISASRIVDVFEESISVTRECVDTCRRTQDVSVFHEGVDSGVSVELLNAIIAATMHGDSAISVSREATHVSKNGRQFVFEPRDIPILESAGRSLAESDSSREETLIGNVVVLHREPGINENTIRMIVDSGPIKKARVELSPEQYDVALRAHADDVPVSITGKLVKRGSYYWLQNCTSISVEPEENNAVSVGLEEQGDLFD